MLIDTYNQDGQKIGQTRLPAEIFEIPMNSDLVHQVVVSQMANRRKVIAHTKTRGEVSGGGKKPWAQKGLGRARHGSIRSPIWRHGGVVFGPRKEKIFKKKIPKKMKRKALFMVLSAKVKSNLLILIDKLELAQAKTKLMAEIIENCRAKRGASSSPSLLPAEARKLKIENFKNGSVLIALPVLEKNIILAARNLPKVQTIQAKDLNALDLLSFKYLILPKESFKIIKETFLK